MTISDSLLKDSVIDSLKAAKTAWNGTPGELSNANETIKNLYAAVTALALLSGIELPDDLGELS